MYLCFLIQQPEDIKSLTILALRERDICVVTTCAKVLRHAFRQGVIYRLTSHFENEFYCLTSEF